MSDPTTSVTPVDREIRAFQHQQVKRALQLLPREHKPYPLLTPEEYRKQYSGSFGALMFVIVGSLGLALGLFMPNNWARGFAFGCMVCAGICWRRLRPNGLSGANNAIEARNNQALLECGHEETVHNLIVEASGVHGYARAEAASRRLFEVTAAHEGDYYSRQEWVDSLPLPEAYKAALNVIAEERARVLLRQG